MDAPSNPPSIRLKVPTQADYTTLYPRRFRPEILRWADDQPYVPTLEEFLGQRRQRIADPTCIERIICADDHPIGTITAFGINRRTADCELGVVIVDPDLWGRGIGGQVLELFFTTLRRIGVQRVYLETFADNERARNAFIKAGFTTTRRYTDPELNRAIIAMARGI